MAGSNNTILDVRNLEVRFFTDEGTVKAVNGVNLSLEEGEAIGIVGESGCGKSVTSFSFLQLVPKPGRITKGQILFKKRDGSRVDIAKLHPNSKEMRQIRGGEISMIFQEPMSSLSPVHTIYNQVSEAMLLHNNMTVEEARKRVAELLNLVGIPNAEKRMDDYPFQFSGGMRQRVMIATAMASNPRVLIADEPTTALDVTIQAQVLQEIRKMREEMNLSLILITHDLGVVAHMVERIYVMYLGRVVEHGTTEDIFFSPKHPYTRALLRSIPTLTMPKEHRIHAIEGTVPNAYTLPKGCSFYSRCTEVCSPQCSEQIPELVEVGDNHWAACFHYQQGKEEKLA